MAKNYTINDDGVIRWRKNGKVPSKKLVKQIIMQEGGQNSVRYMSETMCNIAREIDDDRMLLRILKFMASSFVIIIGIQIIIEIIRNS